MTMNKIIIIGNLGRDPEMRYLASGDAVTNFSVATSRRYKTRDGDQREETTWFNISAWGRLAEVTNQFLSRGSKVYVEGRLSSRTYQTQSGETRVSLDVRASEIQFIDTRNQNAGAGGDFGAPGANMPEEDAEDLPW